MDQVARLALLAGRLEGRIALADVSPSLRALLELAGLELEMEGQAELGEEPLGIKRARKKPLGDLPP